MISCLTLGEQILKKESLSPLSIKGTGMGGGGEAGLPAPYEGGEATYYYSWRLPAAIRIRLKK